MIPCVSVWCLLEYRVTNSIVTQFCSILRQVVLCLACSVTNIITLCFCLMSTGISSYSSKTVMTLCVSVWCQLACRRIPQRLLWYCVFLSDVNWHVVVFLKDCYDTVCICLMRICINLPSLPHPHLRGAQTRVRAQTHTHTPGRALLCFCEREALHDIGIKFWTVTISF